MDGKDEPIEQNVFHAKAREIAEGIIRPRLRG
jgi:hypothetical protein